MLTPAIILSSHTAGLGVIRSLGIHGIPIISIYYDRHDMGYVSKYVTRRVRAPHPEEQEEPFVDLLIDCLKREGGGVVFPADDATLSVVSRHKARVERYGTIACTDWGVAEKYLDKRHTYAIAERYGIPHPRTFTPASPGELAACAAAITYPCLVKPCQSHVYSRQFRRKLTRVGNAAELHAAVQEARQAGLDVMLQEYIPGDDTNGVNYNSYYWSGRPLMEFTARKLRMSPPEFGVPSAVESRHIPEIVEPGRTILEALGYYGYSCTEFKKDPRDDTYKLLEVNGRHNRSTLLSVACGINFPWIEYCHLLTGTVPKQQPAPEGHWWVDDIKDLAGLFARNRRAGGVREYLAPYRRGTVFSVYERDDMKPICKRVMDLAMRAMTGDARF
jgi:predicted ATP-grasp superfamily ATP-dependent carboligase